MLQHLSQGLSREEGPLFDILKRHPDVAGVSLGLIVGNEIGGVSLGYARVSTEEIMTPLHYLECASLSKTVATAFALEYFGKRGICFHSTPVNVLLEQAGSPWRITLPPGGVGGVDWPNQVVLSMLVNHTALGMHYVYGIPISDLPMPSSLQLLDGSCDSRYGYKRLFIERQPGESFSYSGVGFVVLQHLIECFESEPMAVGNGKSIEDITRPWLDACGLLDFTFSNESSYCAFGHLTRRKEVAPNDGGRLAFPAFAAGGLCTPTALATFLSVLSQAYDSTQAHSPNAYPHPISHQTARAIF